MILVQDILDENYTIGYQLAVGVIGKLNDDNLAQVESDALSSTLGEKWAGLYANFLQTDTDNMYEVLSECIAKSKEASFVDYTRIDLKEFSSFSATGEDSIETGDKRTLLSKAQPLILENIAKNFEKTVLKLKEKAES